MDAMTATILIVTPSIAVAILIVGVIYEFREEVSLLSRKLRKIPVDPNRLPNHEPAPPNDVP